ncbi:MAG: hypothetical protein P1U81_15465 [Verrucomicrobiales bacterium]|nr:hypothetical protein [Verrucomicrobiales bacterium]
MDFSRTFNTEFYIDRDGGRTDETAIGKVLGVRVRIYKGDKMIAEDMDENPASRGISGIQWQNAESSEGTVIKD